MYVCVSICIMIGVRLLLVAVSLAAVAYVWNTLSRVPVNVSIEPAYDYIIGSRLKFLLPMFSLHSCNIQVLFWLLPIIFNDSISLLRSTFDTDQNDEQTIDGNVDNTHNK